MIKKYAAIVFLTFWMVGASAFAASYKYYIKIVAPAVPVMLLPRPAQGALPAAKKDQLLEIVEKRSMVAYQSNNCRRRLCLWLGRGFYDQVQDHKKDSHC
ncbi:MAG: hypothetical protein R3A45_03980 [Bdellovibrionota bacterium]